MASNDILIPIEPSGDEVPTIRTLSWADLRFALDTGLADFRAMPTHAVFVCAFYPIVGLLIGSAVFKYDLVPLLFPIASGFAIVGPIAAVGLYELSRRKAAGLDTSWTHMFDVFRTSSFWSLTGLTGFLVVIFALWILSAQALYDVAFPGQPLTTSLEFIRALATPAGSFLIISGVAIGAGFALVAASTSVIAMPMLLDRHVSLATAVGTSLRVVAHNPRLMLSWFFIVAGSLVLGSLPFFMGLPVVLPILGHSTWHLYQRAVQPAEGVRPIYVAPQRAERFGAQFPASLFAGEPVRQPPRQDRVQG
ncbi:MAG: DUF2189 domain-containing protein [Hyphomicrobiales bacterium]|nr:MAG: DUF2189 domain-containing protein [Hyphomicrobiales bacterium]